MIDSYSQIARLSSGSRYSLIAGSRKSRRGKRYAEHPVSGAIILAQKRYFSDGRGWAHRGHYPHDLRPLTDRAARSA